MLLHFIYNLSGDGAAENFGLPLPWPVLLLTTTSLAVVIGYTIMLFSMAAKQKQAGTKVQGKGTSGKPAPAKEVKDVTRFTLEEIARHNKESDCWIIVKGKVYDVTDYVIQHPGGDAILNNAGGDSTEGFYGDQHPSAAFHTLEEYLIGEVAT